MEDTIRWGNKIYDLKEPKGMEEFVNFIYKDILFFPKHIPSTNKIIFLSICLTAFTIGLGLFLSINFNNWLWFSRFGSICTLIAVLFIFYDISIYYDKKIDAIERSYIFIDMISESFIDKILSNPNLPDKQKEELKMERDKFLKDIEENRKQRNYLDVKHEERLQKNKMRICEVCILIIGTLIWGFGDLIGCV